MEDVVWLIMKIRWFFYEILWLSSEIWQLSLETSGGYYRRCRLALLGVVGGFYERDAGSYGKYVWWLFWEMHWHLRMNTETQKRSLCSEGRCDVSKGRCLGSEWRCAGGSGDVLVQKGGAVAQGGDFWWLL
jgi:hypothetical protein